MKLPTQQEYDALFGVSAKFGELSASLLFLERLASNKEAVKIIWAKVAALRQELIFADPLNLGAAQTEETEPGSELERGQQNA